MGKSLKVTGLDEFRAMLDTLGKSGQGIAKKGLYDAAKVMTDAIKAAVEALPVEDDRYIPDPNKGRNVVTVQEKQDMIKSLGISKMDNDDGANLRIGFHGYDSRKTEQFPGGRPVVLIARSIESGSSYRRKHPFFRTAVNAAKNAAMDAAEKTIEDEINKITGGR